MHLSDYMAKHNLSDADMARRIKRSRPTVSRIRRGIVLPDWSTVALLKTATKGAVTPNDFVPPTKSRERAGAA